MIDATDLKAHPTASSLKRGAEPRLMDRTKGGITSKLMGSATAKVLLCGWT